MQPSDSPVASAGTPVSLARGLPRVRTLVLSRPGVRPWTPGASEAWVRVLRRPALTPWTSRGLPGYWAALFTRAVVVHPASGSAALPNRGDASYCLQGW
jgi:hypothetical protein